MKTRSAILIASSVVATLLAGGTFVAIGGVGPESPSDSAIAGPDRQPMVRTIHRTVTVHRRADAAGTATAPAHVITGTTASSDDDAANEHGDDREGAFEDGNSEHEGFDDD
jgi:hypothetical protein